MDISLPESDTRRLPDLGIALKSILAFWLLYMGLITLRAILADFPDFWAMFARRGAAAAVGSALTFLVYLGMRPVARKGLNAKAAVAALLSIPGSILFSAFNIWIFYVYAPLETARNDASMKDDHRAGGRSGNMRSRARSPGISSSPPGRRSMWR